MIEPVPDSWPVRNLGYQFMILSLGRNSSFVDPERVHWCREMFGHMKQGGWIDSGSWMCFRDSETAALYDMTWG